MDQVRLKNHLVAIYGNFSYFFSYPTCSLYKRAQSPTFLSQTSNIKIVCHCGLVESGRTWDRTSCEFESWQCRIYITSHIHRAYTITITRVISGFPGYIWLDTRIGLKKIDERFIAIYRVVWTRLSFGTPFEMMS